MKKLIFGIMMALVLTSFAFAATTADQTVTVSVSGIAELSGVASTIDLLIPATAPYESALTDNKMTIKSNMARSLKVDSTAFSGDATGSELDLTIEDESDATQTLITGGSGSTGTVLIANAIGYNGEKNFELQASTADIFAVKAGSFTATLTYSLVP